MPVKKIHRVSRKLIGILSAALPEEERQNDEWRYWKAQALQRTDLQLESVNELSWLKGNHTVKFGLNFRFGGFYAESRANPEIFSPTGQNPVTKFLITARTKADAKDWELVIPDRSGEIVRRYARNAAPDSAVKVFAKLEQPSAVEAWEVLAEAVQTVMRRYGIPEPYEKLKSLTRGQAVTRDILQAFITSLEIPESEKERLLKLNPETYIGLADRQAREI